MDVVPVVEIPAFDNITKLPDVPIFTVCCAAYTLNEINTKMMR
jgi:hypothetical protein